MKRLRWPARIVAALLLSAAGRAAGAQESFVEGALSPNADRAIPGADRAALHDFHTRLRDRQRWGIAPADVSVLERFIAEDAVLLGRFGEIRRGRGEMLRWLGRVLGFGEIANMRLTVGAAPGLIYVTGRYHHLIRRPDGRGRFHEDLGSYAMVWERGLHGQWRIQSALVAPEPNPGSPANPFR